MSAFAWIADIVNALGKLLPRLLIVRATHGGIKWRLGSRVKAMLPGLHVYWPLTTEVELIVTARQTLNLPTQVLMTADRRQVVVGTVVVYRVSDVLDAIGQRNWDHNTTICDITQAAVVEVIAKGTLDELSAGIANDTVNRQLTAACRRRLRQFGVSVNRCAVTDFAPCRAYRLIGNELSRNEAV